MTLVDFIGFIVALIAMFFMFMKRVAEEKRRRSLPEEKGQTLEEFLELKSDHYHEKLKEPEKKPSVVTAKKNVKREPAKAYQAPKSNLAYQSSDSYEVIQRKTTSRGHSLVKKMRNPSEMFVLKEIMDKPLAIRNPEERQ